MINQKIATQAPATFSSLEKKIALALLVVWLVYVAGLLVALPPYWALMDDHALLAARAAPNVTWYEWVSGFMGGGMFRPTYGIFAYFFYEIFSSSSFLAYAFLYFINILIFFAWGRAFNACMGFGQRRMGTFTNNAAWTALFVVLCFHFIRNNNLFYFASLQERAVIFFLAPAILLAVRPAGKSGAVLIPLLILFLLTLGFLAKATAIIFLPLFSMWFFLKGLECREARVSYWALAALFLTAFLAASLFFSSIRQAYSAGYDFKNAFLELRDPQSKFYRLLLLSFLTSALVVWNYFHVPGANKRSLSELTRLFQVLFWPLGVAAYASIMLPWQGFLSYYLIIPVGMFLVGTKLILFKEAVTLLNCWKKLPYGLFFIMGIALTSITPMWKFYQKAVHHHGTGKAVAYLEERIQKEGGHVTIRVAENCEETASAIGNFLHRPGTTPMVMGDNPFYTTPPLADEKKLLVTHRECPKFPGSFSPVKVVFRYGEWIIYEQSP